MIDDNERREVAARLRESREFISSLPKTTPEKNVFDTFELILACIGYEAGNLFDYLADLIDRPTCKNASGCDDVFECSECRCKAEVISECGNEYGELFHVPYMPSYCPACGAKVEGVEE